MVLRLRVATPVGVQNEKAGRVSCSLLGSAILELFTRYRSIEFFINNHFSALNVLVFSKTTEFRHESIEDAVAMFERIQDREKWVCINIYLNSDDID